MREYGLIIEFVGRHGTDYVTARLAVREPGKDYPLGCTSDGESRCDPIVPKHIAGLFLDGLGMHGFVSEYEDCAYIGHEIEYRDVYSIDLPKLARMTKTLKRVVAYMSKAQAHEPGDRLVALAAALKLSFVVERRADATGRSFNPNPADWHWMTVPQGRDRFRALIEQARANTRRRLGKVAS